MEKINCYNSEIYKDLKVPQKFLDISIFPDVKVQIDHLTGVPIESDQTRNYLIEKFSECIRSGKEFLCTYTDLDNLKTVNDVCGRKVGDAYIQWGSAKFLNSYLQTNPDKNFSRDVFAVRKAFAADEIIIWDFDVKKEEVMQWRLKCEEINTQKENIAISEKSVGNDLQGHDVSLSLSMSTISSTDEHMEMPITDLMVWLEENPGKHNYHFFENIESIVDHLVKMVKLDKDNRKTESYDFGNGGNLEDRIVNISKEFGGGRISERILATILRRQSVENIHLLRNALSPETYKMVLSDLGMENFDFFDEEGNLKQDAIYDKLSAKRKW